MNNPNKKRIDKTVKDSSDFDDEIQETNLDQVQHNKWLENLNRKDINKLAENAGNLMRKKLMINE